MTQLRNLLRDAHLSERYDRTPRTINNWKRKKILPAPDLTIAGRDYWYPKPSKQTSAKGLAPSRPARRRLGLCASPRPKSSRERSEAA
jgi:hypothetical protein